MSFDALLQKVKQAETALEAQERQAAADWRQFKASWRAAWTPGRIVVAGLVAGFLTGRVQPLKRAAAGGGALQLLSALAGLFASGSAQAAAGEAGHAADNAQQTAAAVGVPAAAVAQAAAAPEPSPELSPDPSPELSPEATQKILRRAGLP